MAPVVGAAANPEGSALIASEPVAPERKDTAEKGSRTKLRALIVDDSQDDVDLLVLELRRVGYAVDWIRVDGPQTLLAALMDREWDVVISDFSMPSFTGLHALDIVQSTGLDLPFLMVSGTIGEEAAVEALRAGAHDFLVKGKLARLAPVIDREVREAQNRRDHFRSEVSLRASEIKYRRIVETAQEGIWVVDADLKTVYTNRRMAEMLGHGVESLNGSSMLEFLDEESRAAFADSLRAGERRFREQRFVRRDGTDFWASLSNTPEFREGIFTSSLLMATDVTEQRKLHVQLMVSDRMASVGILAAGVAHEINNPLAAVLANVDLANDFVRKLAKTSSALGLDELIDELTDAGEAARRVRQIVRDLRIFSRSEEELSGPVELDSVLESTLRMAWNEIRHRAKLVKDFATVPPVEGNESRLGQVFLNLIVNAAQAIPEGHAGENQIRIRLFSRPDGRIEVAISDTGSGIPPEVQKRLFTPFFTTKPKGIGTGLGLSICMKIVTGMGGTIELESQVGRGTTFRVLLRPATTAAEVQDAAPVVVGPTRRGRVMVIDDEPLIGSMLKRILSLQHDVAVSQKANEVLQLISGGERYDVILCDLMMPEMTGMDLYARLSELAPAQARAMVFLTGGAFTPAAQAFLERVDNRRLEKPFEVQTIQSLINDCLSPAGEAGAERSG